MRTIPSSLRSSHNIFAARSSALFSIVFGGLLLLTGSVASAAVVFSDDFESANLTNWTTTVTSPLESSTAQNVVPVDGSYSAYLNSSLDRMHRNIIGDNGGVELGGHFVFTSWIYDDGSTTQTTGSTRVWNEVRGYSAGTGLPNGGTTADGALAQLFALARLSLARHCPAKALR